MEAQSSGILTTETLGDLIDGGYTVYATCHTEGCARQSKTRPLPLEELAARHGRNHRGLAEDFRRITHCQSCGGKDFGITIVPDYEPRR